MNSILALIIANSIPLLGVLFFGWTVDTVLLTYWAESAVIGFFTILKALIVGFREATGTMGLMAIPVTFFTVAFFLVHYSGFMIAHVAVLLTFLSGQDIATGIFEEFPIINFGLLYSSLIAGGISLFAVAALFVSHGISFVVNFLGKKEYYRHIDSSFLLSLPYRRILLMHGVIIVGGILMFTFGLPTYLLSIFILFKIIADVRAHRAEHQIVLQ